MSAENYRKYGISGGYPTIASYDLPCDDNQHIGIQRKECDRTEQQQTSRTKSYHTHLQPLSLVISSLKNTYPEAIQTACISSFPFIKRASLTIEAAIALPLFIFMMFILIFPLKIMEQERRLQNTAEYVGKQLASAEYIKAAGTKLLKKDSEAESYLETALNGIEEGAALGIILAKAAENKNIVMPYFSDDTVVFSGESQDMFRAELIYDIRLPISAYSLSGIRRSTVVNRRAWTGADGGRGRSKYGGDDSTDEADEDRIVYLGKTSTVYHDDPNCHYLSNVMQTGNASDMEALRNESGGKYHACPSCRPGSSGTVYYFASGTAYHSSEHCKAITAYSRTAHLSEVGGMRACSYCGRSH